ncbi:MAG: peptide deformylase [Candidatus Saccharimonadales bacterium]
MKILRRTQFGNPVLREKTRRLSTEEILSDKIQTLIANMHYTLENKKYGVGLAATQVGQSVAITAIGIKPTPTRPNLPVLNMTVINPEIIKTYGDKEDMWEGCVSFGDTKNFPYALVPRYKKVRLRWLDEHAKPHEKDFEGIVAHVLQHETDHLNGILFVDRVEDTKSYITIAEYKKRYMKP